MIKTLGFVGIAARGAAVPTHPPSGSHRGWVTSDGGGVLTGSLRRSYPWAVGLSFGNTDNTELNTEFNMELWSVVSFGLC